MAVLYVKSNSTVKVHGHPNLFNTKFPSMYRVNTEFVNDTVWYAQQLMNEHNRNFLHPNANSIPFE